MRDPHVETEDTVEQLSALKTDVLASEETTDSAPADQKAAADIEMADEPDASEEEIEAQSGAVVVSMTEEPAADVDWLDLKAIINMRTYIKIYVDGGLPKEYMFEPGSSPQWKAREGFDILVGNAAGVEFEFNGKQIKNLGGVGKVVRLKLPEN